MRRNVVSLSIVICTVAALAVSAGPALAKPKPPTPIPSDGRLLALLLTKAEMVTAAGYSGTLADSEGGGPSCGLIPEDKSKDCYYSVMPADWANTADYPFGAYITAFPTAAAANKHWTSHNLNPQPYSGETITIVEKSPRSITWYAVPADPAQMAWSYTAMKGATGIMSANCGANTTTPDLTALAACSKRVATAQFDKVSKARPKTPLA